jgi:hypothetical protein
MNLFVKHGSATVDNPIKDIDGSGLKDGDLAFLFNVTLAAVYAYILDIDCGIIEFLPEVVAPTNNAADKRWLRLTLYS